MISWGKFGFVREGVVFGDFALEQRELSQIKIGVSWLL